MSSRDRNLLRQIEQAILDDGVGTTSILQKCIILGGRAGSITLRDWAAKELRGYGPDDALPPYRTLEAIMKIDGQAGFNLIRGQVIGPENLPKVAREAGVDNTMHLRNGLAELEGYATGGGNDFVRFTKPGATMVVGMMNAANDDFRQSVHSLYWEVSRAAMAGVVHQVRTSLAELVGELVASLPPDADTPTTQAADQAVNYIVSGKRNSLTVTSSQVASGSTSTITPSESKAAESWWTRWRKRGLVIGIATVVSAVAGVATWLEWIPWS